MIKVQQDVFQGYMHQTKADVHDWIIRTHNSLIGAGLVQTEDTGQYAESSGDATATTNNQLHGYRVYELNDAYSGTTPVYIRLEFRTVVASAGTLIRMGALTVVVGFATNGAGLIVGTSTSKTICGDVSTSSSGAPTLNPNARMLTVKGDDHIWHNNNACLAYQTANQIYDGGAFAILRSKQNGIVKPEQITFVYVYPRLNYAGLRYIRLTKNGGASVENKNMFRVPRIRNVQGVIVASEADISENGILETTDRLICIRSTADDTPWATYNLSVDGISEKIYLHIPTSFLTTAFTGGTIEKLSMRAVADEAEIGVGGIGVLIDE